MRVIMAGLIAGIVVFVWSAVAHTVLPLGMVGFGAPTDDRAPLAALQAALPEEGVYVLPWLDAEQWGDETAMAEFAARSEASPYAMVVYHPQGRGMSMAPQMAVQVVSNVLGAIIAAWVVSFALVSLLQRAMLVTAMGVFGWLAISLPYWNWYRFPLDFTLAALAEQAIGWLLGGLVIGWWLGRRPPAH